MSTKIYRLAATKLEVIVSFSYEKTFSALVYPQVNRGFPKTVKVLVSDL